MNSLIKAFLLRNMILPLGDIVFGQKLMSRLRFLEEAQYWPYHKILEKQSQDLRALINIAYNEVPLYHHLMDKVGVRPEDIQMPTDLHKLPIVTKDILCAGYPDETTRSTGQKTYEAFTSGSTGKNFIVQEDAKTASFYRAVFLLHLEWTGWSIGEPHLQTGMNLSRNIERKLKDWLFGCHYVDAHRLEDKSLDDMLNIIETHDLNYLWGYPGSIYYLAKYAISKGWNKPLKAVASWGSTLYPHYRKTISQAFHTKVYDAYGSAEGLQIAAQCEEGNYHLHALDTIVEFLDDAGNPVEPGTLGNLIVTRLHPGPMPLIRYEIGDLGVPSEHLVCKCGRTLPLMESIKGRSGDVVLTPSGNRLLSEFFCGILEYFPEVDQFQIIQNSKDKIIIKLVPKEELISKKIDEIINVMKIRGASDLFFEVELVDNLPIPKTGKHRYIISNLID